MLVVFEGIDGCGKDTQIQLLYEYFSFEYFKYPTKTYPILRNYLDKKISLEKKASFLLFLSDIANEQEKLRKVESSSKMAVIDRYIYSTIAYELDVFGYEKSKKIVNEIGYLKPDAVILLDIDPVIAQKRKTNQKQLDRYESDGDYLKKVREKFLQLAKENFHAKKWIVIDASRSIEEVNQRIRAELSKIL